MCTAVRFTDSSGNLFFGRNLDWTVGYGERVVVTPPAAKVPAAFDRPADPKLGHTVMGMGIVVGALPLYFDCANDAGLAIAGAYAPALTLAHMSGASNGREFMKLHCSSPPYSTSVTCSR